MTQWISRRRGAQIAALAGLIAGTLAATAQPLPAAQWQALAPTLQAALECRSSPDTATAAWKALPRDPYNTLEPITPPAGFTVFGLPVREIAIYIDADGEMGASYSASLQASAAAIRKAARLDGNGERSTAMGSLGLTDGEYITLTCTVAGSYDESDHQEPDAP